MGRKHGASKYEAVITCPSCGKKSELGQVHFSFSEYGGHCFVCSYKCSLAQLAAKVGLGEREYEPPVPKPTEPDALPAWFGNAQSLVMEYESNPGKIRLWQGYKPVSEKLITERRLGVGVLPSSKCKHQRLIVPIIDNGVIVGLRGRAIGCDCGKWLVAGGTKLDMLPLYNAEAIHIDRMVWIIENPVDALLAFDIGLYALATYSVSYWRDAWTEYLKSVDPCMVIVAYDNDLPGNGGGINRKKFIEKWFTEHNGANPPEAAGIKLVNRLLEAGLPAMLYDWGDKPEKYDIGRLIADG
jgi:hypothetical protein